MHNYNDVAGELVYFSLVGSGCVAGKAVHWLVNVKQALILADQKGINLQLQLQAFLLKLLNNLKSETYPKPKQTKQTLY